MTDSHLFPYRNVANGHVGFVTHEQAAVFPELLEFVPDYVDPSTIDPEDEIVPDVFDIPLPALNVDLILKGK